MLCTVYIKVILLEFVFYSISDDDRLICLYISECMTTINEVTFYNYNSPILYVRIFSV